MSVICEEIFDETSHPSEAEIKDYAVKIGIDPDSEPHLLPLATEALMKALPFGWKPCYDEKSQSYYYYNHQTKKTQWEHPLDDVYRNLVRKVRTESQSLSLNEPTEDATYAKDDLLSLDEEILPPPPKKLEPLNLVPLGSSNLVPLPRRKEFRILSPLKVSPGGSPKKELRLIRQRSEDIHLGSIKAIHKFGSLDEDNKDSGLFDKHPRALEKLELKVTGGGSMFLKSNTKKTTDSLVSPGTKTDSLDVPRSILRDRSIEHSKSMEFDKLASVIDKSDKDDEDKKSVRFNLDNNTTDVALTFSDKSSDDDSMNISDKPKTDEVINVKVKNRFTVSPVPNLNDPPLKVIKPNPSDFVMPKLTLSKTSDSDEDTKSLEKVALHTIDQFFEDTDESPDEDEKAKFEWRANKNLDKIKQKLWEEKNTELVVFKENLEKSHKAELTRILEEEKIVNEKNIKTQVTKLKFDMKEKLDIEEKLKQTKLDLEEGFNKEEQEIRNQFENKKEEIEKYYEEKLVDIEKELAEKVEKNKEELIFNQNANLDQLKQNHGIIMEELKREFKVEEQILRQNHLAQMADLKLTFQNELNNKKPKSSVDEKQFEKLKSEKRLLEDKYRCLKEKYLRLKTEVKLSIEKRNKKKEHCSNTATTNTTGSETEQSHSNTKDKDKDKTPLNYPSKKFLEKPPTHSNVKSESKLTKNPVVQDFDTSVSDNCYQSDEKGSKNDSSDSTNPGRSRKKLFSRLKSSSTTRVNATSKSRKSQRSCSPVENLRLQLQKLEDLEDQFPQSQGDTYHLRYPFSDGQKFEGSSELEFFRHRIHLEKDSIKRAKESLRTQKTLFQQRQKELKLKHGTMARHTLQQLCQEEKELTDMEVSLHRTRSLLGEKVIRLRHLEQSLHRANAKNGHAQDDSTLSDLSSHSASSGISSTEFIPAESGMSTHYPRALTRGDFQEPSEIIQSLENLNLEIRDIWDVLRNQQQQSSICIPPLVYPDLGWPVLAGAANAPAPSSIPTLADRLHNYRQHVALANAQSTVVTHASQGATTTLVERTKNLRHWLRQTGTDRGTEATNPQANLLPKPRLIRVNT